MLIVHPHRPEAVTLEDGTALVRWSLGSDGATERLRRPAGAGGLWPSADPDLFAVTHLVPGADHDGGRLTVALHRWDTLERDRVVAVLDREHEPLRLAASPDGRWLAVAGIAGWVHLVDLRTGLVHQSESSTETTALRFTPDSGTLLVGWGTQGDGGVTAWPVGERFAEAVPRHLSSEEDCSISLAVDGAGTRLAVWRGWGFDEQTGFGESAPLLRVLELPLGTELWWREVGDDVFAVTPGARYTTAVADTVFTADGAGLLVGAADGHVLLFDVHDGRLVDRLPTGVGTSVDTVALDPDGRRVWALTAGRPVPAVLPLPAGNSGRGVLPGR